MAQLLACSKLAYKQESQFLTTNEDPALAVQNTRLGHPVSVLVGHQGPVTYVDFNKTIPNALLSSSFDGTCRIWDATNSAWPAKVMRSCPLFGPMKGITRFGGTAGPFNAGQSSKPNTRSLEALVSNRSLEEPVNARSTPDGGNDSVEHRLRSSHPPEAAGTSVGAAAATDQVCAMRCCFCCCCCCCGGGYHDWEQRHKPLAEAALQLSCL